jgi:hypothetical protein
MASNSVAASSAGEGSAAVTGYTASNISYSTASCPSGIGNQTQQCVNGVTFTLTSNATSAPANGQPTQVHVRYQSTTDDLNYSNLPATRADQSCSITGWATTGTGAGAGTVTCVTGNIGPGSLAKVDIAANQ